MDLRNQPCALCDTELSLGALPMDEDQVCSSCQNKQPPLPFVHTSIIEDISNCEPSEPPEYETRLPTHPKCLHINLNGLKSRYDDLRNLLENEKNIISCCLSETKLSNSDISSQFYISGYHFLRKDRQKVNIGGGVGMYVNSSFHYEEIECGIDTGKIELLMVKIISSYGKPMVVCTMYIPPDYINDQMFQKLQIVLSFLSSQKYELLICGDFNVDLLTNSSDKIDILRSFNEIGLHQLISEPTRIATYSLNKSDSVKSRQSVTLIDHIFVSKKEKFKVAKSIP